MVFTQLCQMGMGVAADVLMAGQLSAINLAGRSQPGRIAPLASDACNKRPDNGGHAVRVTTPRGWANQ